MPADRKNTTAATPSRVHGGVPRPGPRPKGPPGVCPGPGSDPSSNRFGPLAWIHMHRIAVDASPNGLGSDMDGPPRFGQSEPGPSGLHLLRAPAKFRPKRFGLGSSPLGSELVGAPHVRAGSVTNGFGPGPSPLGPNRVGTDQPAAWSACGQLERRSKRQRTTEKNTPSGAGRFFFAEGASGRFDVSRPL